MGFNFGPLIGEMRKLFIIWMFSAWCECFLFFLIEFDFHGIHCLKLVQSKRFHYKQMEAQKKSNDSKVQLNQTTIPNQQKQPVNQKQETKPKINVQVTKNTSLRVPRVTNEKIMCLLIIIFMIPSSIIYTNFDWIPKAAYTASQYNFQVFCPIYYDLKKSLLEERDKTFSGFVMQHLYTSADKVSIYSQQYGKEQKNIYVVKVMDGQNQTNSTNYGMRYCGLARPRTGTCQNDAKFICTNPGPTFEALKDEEIVVIWVNQINKLDAKHKEYVSKNLSSCYQTYTNQSQRPNFCTLMSKLPQFKDLSYEDPTIPPPQDHYQKYTINNISTPISPYVHGLIGRPSFNGGPLSWFTSRGQVGVGYESVEKQKQNFRIMNSILRRNLQISEVLMKRYGITSFNYRVDVYQNRQLPASLMYYDTAISVTKKNLISGLSGLYIIRDPQIQKPLPPINNQHQIIIHPNAASPFTCETVNKSMDRIKPIAISSTKDSLLLRNTVYRFRITNADFMKTYKNMKFEGRSKNQTVQLDFFVVGTDSSLKNKPLGPVSRLSNLAPGERFDILIKFGKQLEETVDVVYGDHHDLLTRLYLSQKSNSQGSIPSQLPSIPNVDFKRYDNQISRRRMRPFTKTSDDHVATNGHLTIFQGKSEDPYLGTVEDWFLINSINIPQSIHLELAQFQAMDQFTLNLVPNSEDCTFYSADFFMKYATNCRNQMKMGDRTIKPEQFKNFIGETIQDYNQICKYISTLDKTEYSFCFEKFANQQDNEGDKHLSGLDVQQVCQKSDKSAACTYRYRPENSKEQVFKYRGEQIQIPSQRKGFKEIQIVPKMAYSRIRVRWTRNDFPQQQVSQNQRQRQMFFYASEEQLSEYPGYTFRSTQVHGQQSHMLRPIMIKPDPKGKSKTWREIYKKLNPKQIEERKTKIFTSWYDEQF